MRFPTPLIEATLVQRYKRFLADVRLADGSVETVHCPNPGAMVGLNSPGNRVWISDSGNPKRKLRHTLELMQVEGPSGPALVGINTNLPNQLAQEAILAGRIAEMSEFEDLQREVRYGENSRIDILLTAPGKAPHYVEIKNVHLVREAGLHEFPDCKTTRGAKHLRELAEMVKQGARASMLYVIQREDGDRFALAQDFDPDYVAEFKQAVAVGVEAYAIRCKISTQEIIACDRIPMEMP